MKLITSTDKTDKARGRGGLARYPLWPLGLLRASSESQTRSTFLGRYPLWPLGLLAILVVGAVLRLIWVADIEYKADEAWTVARVQEIQAGKPLPLLGMPSSQKLLNPGLSLWVFVPLAEVAGANDPLSLARAVQVLNIVAIVALTAFVLWVVPPGEREPWFWAVALVSVNPLAVLFHRKIWPPCVSPLLITAFLLCWWYRQRRWGALGWGLLGICLGQLHGAGFLFAAGFAGWAFLFDRRRVAWVSWLVGTALGTLPMLPWIAYLLSGPECRKQSPDHWVHALEGKFFTRWMLEPMGFGLDYSLGKDFGDFLRYPLVGGCPTYLVLLLHVVVGVVGVTILVRASRRSWQWRPPLAPKIAGPSSPTAFTQNAALWGYGAVATLSFLPLHRHYMIVLFPLQFLWLARLALGSPRLNRGRALLASLVVCQALLSMQFLGYIHTKTSIDGDYGSPFSAQAHSHADPDPQQPADAELAAHD